jgi:hypothetical protein
MTGSEGEPNTRPISVAELLARNGTIGAPPLGGRRRRRRGKSNVTVAELTGEIPIIRDEAVEPQTALEAEAESDALESDLASVADDSLEAVDTEDVVAEDVVAEATGAEVLSSETVIVYASAEPSDTAIVIAQPEALADEEAVIVDEPEVIVDEAVIDDEVAVVDDEPAVVDEVAVSVDEPEVFVDEAEVDEDIEADDEALADEDIEVVAESEAPAPVRKAEAPPRSEVPLPRRGRGPERGYDPRPKRRGSGAEQMAFDPVDQSVNLADLVGEAEQDAAQLRSYMRSSGGTLFSGETVADDLARRGIHDESDEAAEPPAISKSTKVVPGGKMAALRNAVIAVGQSVLAVVFGAGLFIGFDQLWRWNTIVALVLSVLVILGLVIAVRVVRKTEDIGSTLIAVAVGALVTLGPLALLQSYG